MNNRACSDYVESEAFKAYQDIENMIAQSTAEQAWALYFVSTGMVRENIAKAVKAHIAKGNAALKAAFPEFAQADSAPVINKD